MVKFLYKFTFFLPVKQNVKYFSLKEWRICSMSRIFDKWLCYYLSHCRLYLKIWTCVEIFSQSCRPIVSYFTWFYVHFSHCGQSLLEVIFPSSLLPMVPSFCSCFVLSGGTRLKIFITWWLPFDRLIYWVPGCFLQVSGLKRNEASYLLVLTGKLFWKCYQIEIFELFIWEYFVFFGCVCM